MQTFLPYADFAASARALDDRRLGKQRVEALQVVRALTVPGYGWRHHPVATMWRGYEEALAAYGVAVCEEWKRRGHADTCEAKILDDVTAAGVTAVRSQAELAAAGRLPPWLGDEAFHRSHRAALVRKDPEHYAGELGPVDPDLPYVWPGATAPPPTAAPAPPTLRGRTSAARPPSPPTPLPPTTGGQRPRRPPPATAPSGAG